MPLVRTPTNVTPANGATDVSVTPFLTGNAFGSVYGVTQASSRWQVDTTSDFASPVYDSGDLGGSFDPYSTNVSLAAHFDDTFYELTGKTFSASGNVAVSSTQSKFGGKSASFDGSGDFLSVAHSHDFEIGSGDFTFECWFYIPNTTGQKTIFAFQSDFHYGVFINGNKMNVFASSNGSSWDIISGDSGGNLGAGTITVTANAWHHFAWTRSGTTWTMWLDGVLDRQLTAIGSTVYTRVETLNIGRWGNAGYWMNGYIDDLRLTKGVSRYTSAFTPPTSAFLPILSKGITNQVDVALAANTPHYWRCRYRDSDNVDSAWSTGTSFTTGYPPD